MRAICVAIFFLAACGPKSHNPGQPPGGDDDGSNQTDAPGIDPYQDAAVDSSCGAQTQNIGVVNLGDPPDLLIVLDRSGSMNDFPPAFPPIFNSKWNIMRDALNSIAMQKDQNIRFGLLEFPSDDNCTADANPEVPIALGQHGAIATYFAGRSPNGNTPAHIALGSALSYYNTLVPNPAGRYVLFATDGLPNCLNGDPNTASDTETVAAVTSLHNAGIPTYVIGFGTLGLNTGVLNDAATAGGKAKPGTTKFYEADTPADLAAALQAIAGGVIVPSCSYSLASAPPVPDDVTVTVNGMTVPRSPTHQNGWDYYPNSMTITFFGSYCNTIMTGANTNVSFVYGCPGPVIQ